MPNTEKYNFVAEAKDSELEKFYFDDADEFGDWLEENELEEKNVTIIALQFGADYLFEQFYDSETENFREVFEFLDNIDSDEDSCEQIAIRFLHEERGCSFDFITQHYDEVSVYFGDAEQYADEMIDEGCFGDISDSLRPYIDTESLARDMVWNGDICEFEDYVVTNACEF